ncbi:MAG: MBL fold metallo-hydrolase [Chloroflexi bacterium]|nr:MBL fold metallo-hydrolase [Chloroflexota bacterium]
MQQTDALIQVAEGIYQVQLPLPFALRIVNCYLLDNGDQTWTILDTGLNYAEDQEVWQSILAALSLQPQQIRQIVLTHAHPDHFGLAGWFQEMSGAPVRLSQREADSARAFWGDANDRYRTMTAQMRLAAVPDDLFEPIMTGLGFLLEMTKPHPTELDFIAPGAAVAMGGRTFRAILAPGHSDGQLMFYDAADRLLLSGDHVLMKITPNIGLWPESEAHPLQRFLASLNEVQALDVRLALPGHRALITDWRGRIDEIVAHHEERLEHTLDAVGDGATAYQIAGQLFDFQRLSVHEMRFALVEALAHLDYLIERGAVRQSSIENGVWWFEHQH